MNQFIRVKINVSDKIWDTIVSTDTIDMIGVGDEDKVVLAQKDGTKLVIEHTVDEIWDMLKPSIIFA